MSEQQTPLTEGQEEVWLAPSLFPDAIPTEQERLEAMKRKKEEEYQAQKLAAEERHRQQQQREAARLAEEQTKYVPLHHRIIMVILTILVFICYIVFFIPFCILGLFGLSKHPILGYFAFRNFLRSQ